jgi:hypothetical protein
MKLNWYISFTLRHALITGNETGLAVTIRFRKRKVNSNNDVNNLCTSDLEPLAESYF